MYKYFSKILIFTENALLPDALSFYQYAENNTNGIEMYFMPSAQIKYFSLHYIIVGPKTEGSKKSISPCFTCFLGDGHS